MLLVSNHPNRSRTNRSSRATPKPDEIRAAREIIGLTQEQAAEHIYGTLRSWQDYEGGQRRMHPAIFELFLLKTGQLSIDHVVRPPGQ